MLKDIKDKILYEKYCSVLDQSEQPRETPIAESMKQAAEKLNYEESPTTVILISDGEESCNADPCAMAKKLEESGTNFTAHVIGFDVSDTKQAKAREQLKCVAENTGGQFIEAKDSAGLKEALIEMAKVVAKPVPAPKPIKIAKDSNLPFSDSFEREELGDDYEVDKPDADRMAISDGKLLIITVDPKKNRVKMKQSISGNFEAIVKMTMNLTNKNYAGFSYSTSEKNSVFLGLNVNISENAGLLGAGGSYDRNNRALLFNKYLNKKKSTKYYQGKIGKRNADISYAKIGGDAPQEDWYFKITKVGFKLSGYASTDGKKWVKIGEHALLKKEGYIGFRVGGKGAEDPILFDDLIIKAID